MRLLDQLDLGFSRQLPMVLQSEAAECGLASLVMVAHHHGYRGDLPDLRRRYGLSLKGATLRDLMRIADHIGFATRPVRLELDELPQLRLPCILHWDLNHFVVLASVGPNGAVIHDPAVGIRRLSIDAVSRHFTGVALELSPTSQFKPADPPPRIQLSQLTGRVTGIQRALLQLLAIAFSIEVLAMASPFFLGWVIDHAIVSADRDLLITLAIGFTLLLLMRTAITAMRGWMLMGLNASLKIQTRANLFTHLVALPVSFFETRYLADVMSRFGSQETILQAITSELVEAVLDGIMAIATLVIMFILAPGLTLIVLLGALLYGLLRWISYRPLQHATAEAIVWAARRDSHFLETMRGIRTVKLFNAQLERRVHWLNLLVETINRTLLTEKLRLLFQTCNTLLFGLLAILVVWFGARHILDGTFSVGLLIAFIAYKDQFLTRISELINRAVDLSMLRLHAERLADIALTPPEDTSGPLRETGQKTQRPVSVELRKVSFRYADSEPWILKDLTFRFEAGVSTVVTGPSGGGKSTLLKLLSGLIQPTEGEILVDGEPLKRQGLSTYRDMIGVVMQDDQLFAGSIADNISFFAEQPDMDLIEGCARSASVHDDIVAMPMGYSSLIGDMGTALSGGQKQRVLLARALYRLPSLLLLDEATSHLDVEREAAVNAALQALPITRIIIAHRPETIRASDRHIELINGRLCEPLKAGRDDDALKRRGTPTAP